MNTYEIYWRVEHEILDDETKDMAGTSTWNDVYSILFKFPSDPSQDQIYGGPKKCLMSPLIELHMIFRPPSTKFRLLKFLNNHSHENSKLANLLWPKNKLLSFSDIFPFFFEEASKERN